MPITTARLLQDWDQTFGTLETWGSLRFPAISYSLDSPAVIEDIQFDRVSTGSALVAHAALLHTRCLPKTITSQRDAVTLAGIYERLLQNGHAIYVATRHGSVLGGIVILEHHRKRATVFTLIHRPWSWISAIRRLGVAAFSKQLLNILAVQRAARGLPAHNYIVAVYVDPETRRAGIARQLLGCAVEDARSRRVALAVDTLQSNSSAQVLYRNLGFTERQRTKKSVMLTVGVE